MAKQGLELSEKSRKLCSEINRLGTVGDGMGIRGRRGFGKWYKGLSVGKGRKVASVDSVDVWSGNTRSRGSRRGGGSAPSCLKMAVDITSFIVCWMGPAAKGARRRG